MSNYLNYTFETNVYNKMNFIYFVLSTNITGNFKKPQETQIIPN